MYCPLYRFHRASLKGSGSVIRQPLSRLALFRLGLIACFIFILCPVSLKAQIFQKPTERELAGGEVHTYRIPLEAGQFIRAVFDQRGIDIVLTLLGPNREKLVEVDTPVGKWGPEPLFFEVDTSGIYTIEVRPRLLSAPPGRYEFSIEARRMTAADKKRLPAERAFAEATQLLLGKTPDSLQKGIERYKDALRAFSAAGDKRGEITTLTTIAAVSHALGEEQDALNYFNQALPLQHESGDKAGEAMTLSNIALVYNSLGSRRKALDYFQRALDLFQQVNDERTAAYTLTNIGSVYDAMGEKQTSLDYFAKALALFTANHDHRGEAYTLNNIGLAYATLGDKEKSRQSYDEALMHLHHVNDCSEVAPTLSNAAFDLLNSGDKQKALDFLNQALVLQQGINDRQGEATTLNNIGFVYNTLGQLAKALDYFTRALALHREVKNLSGEGDTLGNLMFTWANQRKSQTAIFYGKQAVNIYQEVRASIAPLDKEAQQSFLKSKESTYRELADLLIASGRILEAQQVLDMLKEEEYFQFIRRDGNESGLSSRAAMNASEAEKAKRYKEIADQLAALGAQRSALLAKTSRTPDEDSQLEKIQADLRIANQEFQKFLTQLSAELGSAGQGKEKVTQLKEAGGLQPDLRELGSGAVALYTLIGEEKYRVILITPDVKLTGEYPIKAEDLYAKIADFREALQNPNIDPRPLGQELYKILVGPVAKDLQDAHAQTLMWSLDGVLRYLPMAALYDGEKYMVERYRNVVFTPASLARLKDQPAAKWKALGFGVSKAQGDFAALPAVPDELRGIIREEGADPVLARGVLPGKIMLDEAFTEESFQKSLQQHYPLVHIASHFQFQPGTESNSFLLMGDGSHYSLDEIQSEPDIFAGVDLLALSACNTATASAGADGKEVEGFGVLAQRLGAKSVLASLWPVADESTRLLMQSFYRFRDKDGLSKAEAMQRAQQALLRGEVTTNLNRSSLAGARKGGSGSGPAFTPDPKAPFAHPYFWAPFILIGNWR